MSTIPKIIHHTWFGPDRYSKLIKKCISSWERYLPEYELMLWTTDNFDINISNWTKQAFNEKKYAFVADYARYYVLYEYGGIYLDADVEVLKKLDPLLKADGFIGFGPAKKDISGTVIGSIPEHPYYKQILNKYNNTNFLNENGDRNIIRENVFFQEILLKEGLQLNDQFQNINGINIYPYSHFPWTSPSTIFTTPLSEAYTLHRPYGSWKGNKLHVVIDRMFNENYLLINKIGTKTIGDTKCRKIMDILQEMYRHIIKYD